LMKESTYEFYKVLEHTADMALEVYGRNLKELFSNTAFALFDVVANLSEVEEKTQRVISLHAIDLERLMVKWLNELLYYYEVENLLFKRFEIKKLEPGELEAIAYGEVFREGVHVIFTNPKAVTHHKIEIAEGPEGWRAKIIIDL
ncbi:MAG TPA: archease, partial [Candidatus Hypogeohydataceae bacterium YC41]